MNKDLKFKGIITHILPTQSGTSKAGKEWSKTEFVVKDNAEYPQIAKFEIFNKPEIVKFLKVGSEVEVSFNLNTNEYKDKFYTSLSAWKVWNSGNSKSDTPAPNEVTDLPEEDGTNLPF